MPFGQVSFCASVVLSCILFFLSFPLSPLSSSPPPPAFFLPAAFLLSFFPFLRLSFQVFVINLYFVKGFCCTRFCILTESDWLLFSSPKSGFCSHHLSPSCPVTVLVLAPSISNVQTVLATAPSLRPAALGAILYSISLLGLPLCKSPSRVFIQRLLSLL